MRKYARNVHFQIKEGKRDEFAKVFESDVIPMLKQQEGFRDELTLVNSDNAMGISLWDSRANADSYDKTAYPKVLNTLNPLLEGTPRVETYQVGATTLNA
ncbi:MAG: antibiotic biosynthesis monooxygenase family protein [Longimicrobiaceae bacterium]|jgi:quinol monooxygenase YgiN